VIPTRAMQFGRVVAGLCLLGLAALPASAEVVNKIVALVDGDPITAHEVRRYGEERRAANAPYDQLLDAVITEKLIAKEIASRKIVAKREDVDKYIQEVMTRNKMNDEQFNQALKQQGSSMDQYRSRIKNEMERSALVGQELQGEAPEITDADIERYYDEHKEAFATKSAVTVSDIFFPFQEGMTQRDALRVVEQAKQVKAMADAGQSFASLARRYSQGPGAENGGLIGTFKRGEMAPQLEQIAFALPVGEVSAPIVGPTGVHLMRIDSAQSNGPRIGLDQVKDEIRTALQNRAMDERFRDWIAKNLKSKHHIEVLN
jgi:peptidyl-prolyl cis-trans isomerase SurA